MKVLALVKRRSDLDREAFRRHYEEVHAPLAVRTVLEGTLRYVRHHLRQEIHGRPSFDVVTSFWYGNAAGAEAVMQRVAGRAGEAIRRDELGLMDRRANAFFAVEERPVLGDEAAAAPLRTLALVRRPRGEAPERFAAGYEQEQLPRLLSAAEAPSWCLQNRALATVGPPAFDVVTQLHARAASGLVEWAGELALSGADVVVVRVSAHESRLPWTRRGAGGTPPS